MDFQKDVLERSRKLPVVVDFWAAWCGPCKVLGPVIENLAEEQEGQWDLVKVDTESHQDLSMEYGIRSIPNVKMFVDGQVVAEFAGALPKGQIEKWLEEHIPSEDKIVFQDMIPENAIFPDDQIRQQLEVFHLEHPQIAEAKISLAKFTVLEDPKKALELLAEFRPSDKLFESVEDIRTLSEFHQFIPEDTSDAGKAMMAAQEAFWAKDPEAGIKSIIKATMLDKGLANELPRRTAIAFFRLWGIKHPLTRTYRRQFDMVLY